MQRKSGGIASILTAKLPAVNSSLQELFHAAGTARENAHAPYSHFQVGAAIRLQNGAIFSGCNVENASYGATICAERGAICAAVAACGPIEIVEFLVISDGAEPWPPCGMCRQVIAEFGPDCVVHCANLAGKIVTRRFEELFPAQFGKEFLTSKASE